MRLLYLPNLLLDTAYSLLVMILLLVKLLNEPSRVTLPVMLLFEITLLVEAAGIEISPLMSLFSKRQFFASVLYITLPYMVLLVISASPRIFNPFAVLLYAFAPLTDNVPSI